MRKLKPRFSYATVNGLLLYSEGRGPNGYRPFPMLEQLSREGPAAKMRSSHKKSQETNNKSRSSSLLCLAFLCRLKLCYMNQRSSLLLKFPKVWFLSLADEKNSWRCENKNKHALNATNIQNLSVLPFSAPSAGMEGGNLGS